MEDDDPTPRALQHWVELEYKVNSLRYLRRRELTIGTIAHVHARWPRRVRRIHAPLKRSRRRALERTAPSSSARIVPRGRRARADAIARDRARARMSARPQSARGTLSIRRRRRR